MEVARKVGPIHSTDPASVYLQFAARADVSVADIDRSLYEDRSLLRHTSLRRTVHLMTPELAVAAHGVYNQRLVARLRTNLVGWITGADGVTGDPWTWLANLEDEVLAAATALDRPTGSELAAAVPGLAVEFNPAPGKAYSRPGRITTNVIGLLIADGRLARDRPRRGGLTSNAWTYGPITDWLPDGIAGCEPARALETLVNQRLTAFPGSSVTDLAWWTGTPSAPIRRALNEVEAVEVRRDDGVIGYILGDDPLQPSDQAPAATLLPALDASPMGVIERDWFLGPHAGSVFDKTGNIGPTVWWGGHIVGGWTQRSDGQVVTGLLTDIGAEGETAVDVEADRITQWLGDVRVKWRFPTPLQRRLDGM